MKTVRVFLTCVMLAMLLYVINVGPVAVYGDDDGGSDAEPLCSPLDVDAGEYEGYEGSVLTRIRDATVSNPDGIPLTYSWSLAPEAEEAGCTFDDPSLLNPELTCKDNVTSTATLCARQHRDAPITIADGLITECDDAPVTVYNLPPTCERTNDDPVEVPVDTAITFSADFTDPGVLDTHTAAWDWGDGTSATGTVTQGAGSGSVKNEHSYSTLGLYTAMLTVRDNFPADSEKCTTDVCVYGPILVSPPIPLRKADPPGEIFHTISVTVPALVPGCPECYCLSSQPGECAPMVVDDVLAIFLDDGTKSWNMTLRPAVKS